MKLFLKVNFIASFLIVFALSAFGQTNAKIEQELVDGIKNIQKYSAYGSDYDEEKLTKANEVFAEKVLRYAKVPSTLGYKFSALNEYMFNATSEDGKFRIYSWDTEDGGTMHNFSRVYQYQAADGKVYSKTDESAGEGDAGSFVYDIFTLDTTAGKVYIVCSTFIGSTNENFQSADLYKIEGGDLNNKVKLIKTKSGLTNTLNFEYNFFSVVDREERPVKLILFDKKAKTLKIPVVIQDKEFPNGRVTNRFITYQFNGTYFVKIG